MIASFDDVTVDDAFFHPLAGLVADSPHTRPCPELPDLDFVRLGIHRVLESSPSGRGFIQEHGARFERMPTHSNYFSTLRSARRGDLLKDVHDRLVAAAAVLLPDRLASLPELRSYECFAADGHWHQAATHDPRHDGVKMAVGHFYSLDLRSHALRHLAAAEGLHEHDMSVLKRVRPKGLRQSVPKGRRVIIVYDKAGIDFGYWKRCRQECALYFLSRVKEGMVHDWLADRDWASGDPRNAGVEADRRVMTREGVELRIVTYIDPVGGESYGFLTNEPDLPPGIIVELYRRRWEAEKVFDEIKNKLGEDKAWAGASEARTAQALFITLTHNLMVIYEDLLEREQGVINKAEDARRTQRAASLESRAEDRGLEVSSLLLAVRKATQRPVKFVRWLAASIAQNLAEAAAVPRLIASYQRL